MRRLDLIDQPLFSLAMTTEGGTLAFGGVPRNIKIKPQWSNATVYPKNAVENIWGFWDIDIDNVMFGKSRVDASHNFGFRAILDNGTPNDVLHPMIAQKIAALYNPPAVRDVDGYYAIPCHATPPELGFTVGGQTFWYKPENMVMPHTWWTWGGVDVPDSWAVCMTSFQDSPYNQRTGQFDTVLGASFFRNVLAVFDFEEKRVAMASTV